MPTPDTTTEPTHWAVMPVGNSDRYAYVASGDMTPEQARALADALNALDLPPSALAAHVAASA